VAGEDIERRLAAIMSADVAGYSRLMGTDEAGTLSALKALRRDVFAPQVAAHKGRVVKLMGDGALVEFPSIVNAVDCAIAVQRALAEQTIQLRIGINLGDIIVEGSDIYGDGVNVAARIQEVAEPGSVALSNSAHDQIAGKVEAAFTDGGEHSLKNIAKPVRVWRWSDDVTALPSPPESLSLPDKPSIAVLPFDNMSGDPEQEYFSDGITEDIITELSAYRSIFVIARNSSFVYKGRAEDIKRIGQDLGVRYVLEGSVRKSVNRVRVTAQLIEAATGNHLWAQRYDRDLEDVFELQDEITETIVAAIQPELEIAERERARGKSPDSLDAWDCYQRGMWHVYKVTEEELERAETCFREALAIAPRYVPALAGAAYIDFQRVIHNYGIEARTTREALLKRGFQRASEAVQSDGQDAFAQFVLGRLLSLNGDFDEAIDRLTLALELNPNSAIAHHGLGYAFAFGGRAAEASAELHKAIRLSPKDPYHWAFCTMLAFSLVLKKDYDGAVEWGRKAIRDQPQVFWAYVHVASALGHLGRVEDAKQMVGDLLRVKPDFAVATIDETVRFRKATDRAHLIDGLREAGLDV
jgi:adenylate cyclase